MFVVYVLFVCVRIKYMFSYLFLVSCNKCVLFVKFVFVTIGFEKTPGRIAFACQKANGDLNKQTNKPCPTILGGHRGIQRKWSDIISSASRRSALRPLHRGTKQLLWEASGRNPIQMPQPPHLADFVEEEQRLDSESLQDV